MPTSCLGPGVIPEHPHPWSLLGCSELPKFLQEAQWEEQGPEVDKTQGHVVTSDVGVSSSGREERSICTRPAPPCDQGTQDSLPVENSLGTTDPPREALVGTFTLAGT